MARIWSRLVREPEICSGIVADPCFSDPTD